MSANVEAYLHELADPARPLAVSKLVNLSSMPLEQVSLFMNAWLQMDVRRRRRLIRELMDLAEDNVELNFDAVFFIALADTDAEVRRNAVNGLWEYEGRDLIDPLLGLLERDPDAAVRAEAALALGRFVLQAEFETLRSVDAERVGRGLRCTIDNDAEVIEVRARALESIGARSQPWVRDLIQQALDSPDRRLWLSAVHAMGRSCDPFWLPELIEALGSDDAEMRFEAASACGAIVDEAATTHLLPLLDDNDAEVREAAIGALGQIGGREATEALKRLVVEGNERTREAALSALAEADFAEDPLGLKFRG
jgi:HEAT repeat protein